MGELIHWMDHDATDKNRMQNMHGMDKLDTEENSKDGKLEH